MEQAEKLFREMFGSMQGGGAGSAGIHDIFKGFNLDQMFQGGGIGGHVTEQSIFTNGKGELVQRTRTKIRRADGSVEEKVVERVLRGR